MIDALLKLGADFDVSGEPPERGQAASTSAARAATRTAASSTTATPPAARSSARCSSRARAHPNIALFEDHCGVDLLTTTQARLARPEPRAIGAYVLDARRRAWCRFQARVTLLATGGAGKVYLYTSNPDIATGDGMAMAYRAGATLANMEFVQFHPTCLYHPQAKSFLISEAVRGEGGDPAHARRRRRSWPRLPPAAPTSRRATSSRARSTPSSSARATTACCSTSRTATPAFLRERFPNIYARCLEFGIDITREPIPVVPAAHYCCGGVATDLSGETDVREPVRRRRGRVHRAARRQPARVELAARGARVRRRRGRRPRARALREHGRRRARRAGLGARATPPRATRRS